MQEPLATVSKAVILSVFIWTSYVEATFGKEKTERYQAFPDFMSSPSSHLSLGRISTELDITRSIYPAQCIAQNSSKCMTKPLKIEFMGIQQFIALEL